MLQYNPSITGSLTITGSLVVTGNISTSGSITISGSVASASYALSASEASMVQGLGSASFAPAATFNTVSQSYAASSASLSTRVVNEEATSSILTSASASFAVASGSISSRVTLIEGQYATTGSNNFTGVQYISEASNAISFTSTASLYTDGGLRVAKDSFVSGTAYFNNITVYGTSSIEYITSSQVNIGSNIITVNTDTPAVRFGGLSVFDSGSTQLTGSLFWDSEKNHWIYSNPSGSSYNSAMLMNGPRNTGSLGDEQGTTSNALMKGQGGDHITSSQVIDDGTTVRIPGNFQVTGSTILSSALSGTSATFSGTTRVVNAEFYLSSGNAITFDGAASGNNPYIYYNSGGNEMYIRNNTTNGLISIGNANGNLTFGSTGAATFSSSVTAGGQLKTTAAGQSISINAASTDSVRIQLQNNNVGNSIVAVESSAGGSQFTGTSAYSMAIGTATARDLFLGTNSVARMTITSTGNVGIGTTSPDVTGFGWTTLTIKGGTTAGQAGVIELQNTVSVSNDQNLGIMAFLDGTSRNAQISVRRESSTSTAHMDFFTNAGAGLVERMRITSGGKIEMGSTSVSGEILKVTGSSAADNYISVYSGTIHMFVDADQTNSSGIVGTQSNHNLILRTNGTNKVWVTSGGNVLIGTATDNGDRLNISGATSVSGNLGVGQGSEGGSRLTIKGQADNSGTYGIIARNSSNQDLFVVRNDGLIQTGTRPASPYNNTSAQVPNLYVSAGGTLERGTSSSMRYKENILEWDGNGLSTILALKPTTFTYKESYFKHPERVMLGLIAEEVAEVCPYLADYENEDGSGQIENVRYANIVVPLIKAIQEQQAQIQVLQTRIETLEK